MKYESIADIYSANQKIRDGFTATLSQISPDEATALPDGEKWTIQQVAEHVSIVQVGISQICAKLLAEAKIAAGESDGTFNLSDEFGGKLAEIADLKVEAPERVRPTGNVTLAETVERVNSNKGFDEMRDDFEQLDLSTPKFPHPFLGDLTASEWLVVAGGHEFRHTKQIVRMLEKIRQ